MLIKARIYSDSKDEGVKMKKEDSFDIRVKEKPIEGRANKAAINQLSFFLKIPKNKIRLIKGAKKRNKIFEIEF